MKRSKLTMRDIGELGLIERLRGFGRKRRDLVCGIGDDCAVVRVRPTCAFDLLLTSDPVIEGVHFHAGDLPEAVGHKAIGRVLSDIAAMGGEPLWALIDLVAPAGMDAGAVERIYRGGMKLARKHGLLLVGGDTSSGKTLELHVFAVGRVPRGAAVLRSSARAGDILYVTGALGGSLGGKHLSFEPRVEQGRWLREGKWATAMMDLSDGLATDLGRMARMSRAGAELDLSRIPVSRAAAGGRGRTPLQHALCDGEDFELLFSVRARKRAAFERTWRARFKLPCTAIGRVTGGAAAVWAVSDGRRTSLDTTGYEHFAVR